MKPNGLLQLVAKVGEQVAQLRDRRFDVGA
jgi:hypothetical protein